jgi:pseudouridine-5'-phosphate glycosidase
MHILYIWSIGGSLAVGLSRGELSELFSYDEEAAAKIEKEAAIATATASSSSSATASTIVEATGKKND